MGDTWPERIDQALDRATILVPVIGPSWLRIADEYGRRRLDKEDDWVCNEINHALEAKLHVVPILLMNHHPRWENIWRSVSVALSTWDIGFVPSQLDIDLATFLEELRSSFPAPKRKKA